ncbi:MAG: transposase [Myxococcota bacterium]
MADFEPPFCPNAACRFHCDPRGWRFVRWGTYTRTCPRVRTIPRYRCTHCRRTFSRQTFSPTYWLRRPELLASIAERLLSGSGLRQMQRFLGCSPSTVMTHTNRLGRHALLFQEAHRPIRPTEPLVVDGFESFAFSQDYPLHLNLAVGATSHFVYAFTESELRRKGRMTPAQKRRRRREEQTVGRADPRAIEKGVRTLLAWVLPRGAEARVRSDEHPAYPRAIRRLRDRRIHHETTSSKKARTQHNPLFAVNRQDEMLRHSSANHRRETIAFSKLRAGVIERAALQAVFMNYLKSFSEKKRDATPAQRLGLTDRKWTVREVLRERLFPTRMRLPRELRRYYERRVVTRRIPQMRPHRLRYAF